MVAVGLGAASMLLNNAAFSNDFSTIYRVAKTSILNEDICGSDGDGRQTLPKHLANAGMTM